MSVESRGTLEKAAGRDAEGMALIAAESVPRRVGVGAAERASMGAIKRAGADGVP